MLTGRLPFIANTAAELARMHRMVAPIPPSQLNPLIPTNLEQACLKVLSKEPSSRYRTADQFGRVLISLSSSIYASPNQVPVIVNSSPIEQNHPPTPSQSIPSQTSPELLPTSFPPDPVKSSPAQSRSRMNPTPVVSGTQNALDIDWGTWALVLLMVITLGGLIPLWVWIYFLYNPPGR
jgi:serine/threonine-protein kinase